MRRKDPLEQYLRRPSQKRLAVAVRSHYKFVWRTAFRITGDGEDARDVCQDVFLGLLLDPPAPESVSSVRGFLTWRVLSRVEHLRRASERRRQREKQHARWLAAARLGSGRLDPDELEALRAAIWNLSRDLRMIVELRYLAGMSSQQIATTLDLSERTVQRRLEEARDRLKVRLEAKLAALSFPGQEPSALSAPAPPADLLPDLLKISQVGGALAPPAAVAASGSWLGMGVLLMSGKKIALCAAVALISIVSGLLLVERFSGVDGNTDPTARGTSSAVSDGDRPAQGPQPTSEGGSAPSDAAEESLAAATEGSSIHGWITARPDVGVAQARVLALPLGRWRSIGRQTEGWELYSSRVRYYTTEFRKLREAYRACAESIPETRSGDDGGYVFRNLPEGEYQLLVAHAEFLPHLDSRVTVRAKRSAQCDVELTPGEAIAGRVVDETGRPLPAAEVERVSPEEMILSGLTRLRRLEAKWQEGRPLVEQPRATSAADGTFRLLSLEPGHYVITARKEGYLQADSYTATGAGDVVLTLKRGLALEGRVLNPSRRPVADAEVTISPEKPGEIHRYLSKDMADSAAERNRQETLSLPDGRFELKGLQEGHSELRVTADGFPSLRKKIILEESSLNLGDLVLETPHSIAGHVYQPDGRPASGARVWVEEPVMTTFASGDWLSRGLTVAETTSDANGHFLLDGVPRGPLRVNASADGHVWGSAADIRGGARGVEIHLHAGLTVTGTVVDEEVSLPVADVRIEIGSEGDFGAVTDGEGRFEIRGIRKPSAQRYWTYLRAYHPDYVTAGVDILRYGWREDQPVTISLAPRRRIAGVVRDGQGQAVSGAKVWFEVTGVSGRLECVVKGYSEEDGSFSAKLPTWLSHPHYTVGGDPVVVAVASHPTHGVGRTEAIALPNTGGHWPARTDIVLAPASVVEGRVTDEEASPVKGAQIRLRRRVPTDQQDRGLTGSIRMAYRAYSSSDGSYRIRNLEQGAYELTVLAGGFASQKGPELTVVPGVVRRDITLSRGGVLAGKVTDAEGRSLGNAEVVAFLESELDEGVYPKLTEFWQKMSLLRDLGEVLTRTDPDGGYRLEHLPPGLYTVVGRCRGYDAARIASVQPGESPPDLVLRRFSAIRGTVLASDSMRPITAFSVEVLTRSKLPAMFERLQSMTLSDFLSLLASGEIHDLRNYHRASEGRLRVQHPDGRFLYDGLHGGNYVLLVQAPGFAFGYKECALPAGEEKEVEVRLRRGGSIEGIALDAETGAPIPGAEVDCEAQQPALHVKPYEDSVSTDERGRFSVAGLSISPIFGLRKGTYTIQARHPYYLLRKAKQVEVVAGEKPAWVEVKLAPAGRLEGRVAGLPLGSEWREQVRHEIILKRIDAEGEQRPMNSSSSRKLRMARDGFRADSLEPGRYAIEFKKQRIELGEQKQSGIVGVSYPIHPRGPEHTFFLGEIEIQARKTTRFDFTAP